MKKQCGKEEDEILGFLIFLGMMAEDTSDSISSLSGSGRSRKRNRGPDQTFIESISQTIHQKKRSGEQRNTGKESNFFLYKKVEFTYLKNKHRKLRSGRLKIIQKVGGGIQKK